MAIPDIIKRPAPAMVMGTVISLLIMLAKPSSVAVFATTTMGMIGTVIIPMADIDIININLVDNGAPVADTTIMVMVDTPEVTVEDITADETTHQATLSINDLPLGVSPPAYPIGNGLLPTP